MAVKFHRCSAMWVKINGHPCWKAQKALDEAGVDYELVLHSGLRFRRPEVAEMTGVNAMSVSRAVASLKRHGRIQVSTDPKNRRRKALTLTPEGARLYRAMLPAIARALATRPRLLLLDEPAAGMNPAETHEVTELISRLRDERGVAICVIEHDMHVVSGCSDRVVALDHGVKIAEGGFDAVANDPAVVEAYMGRDPEALAGPG